MREVALRSIRQLRIQLQPRVKEGAVETLTVAGAHRGFAQAGLPAAGHGVDDPIDDRLGFRRLSRKRPAAARIVWRLRP